MCLRLRAEKNCHVGSCIFARRGPGIFRGDRIVSESAKILAGGSRQLTTAAYAVGFANQVEFDDNGRLSNNAPSSSGLWRRQALSGIDAPCSWTAGDNRQPGWPGTLAHFC